MNTIDIIAFEGDLGNQVNRIIQGLGHGTRLIPAHEWLAGSYRGNGNLLLCPLHNDAEMRRVVFHLTDSQPVNSMAILGYSPGQWCDEGIEFFNEFICWPCHDRELNLRLERLQPSASATPSIDESRLLEEFVTLSMIGRSPPFINALKMIKRISRCDAPTLVNGETGTGKELAARAIHYMGCRRDAPFIPVNCGAIPDDLLENELFGHEKGSFTDAHSIQTGMVELAMGGTLFLDEVDALSPKAQVVLLRLIQEREYRPLGSKTIRRADIRVIAASNRDLDQAVAESRFREDLMFRLNVLSLTMPPLRQRTDDIEELSYYLLDSFSVRYDEPRKRLHPETLEQMKRHPWPGNVRELENLLHRESLLCEDGLLRFSLGGGQIRERRQGSVDRRMAHLFEQDFNHAKAEAVANFEHAYLDSLLETTQGNISAAARKSGKERRALGKLIKKHCIDKNAYKPISGTH